MFKRSLFLFVLVCAAVSAQQTISPQLTLNQVNQSFFTPNKGQRNSEVKYHARIGGMNEWITSSGKVYKFHPIKKNLDDAKTFEEQIK